MDLQQFDFHLPEELIAQYPCRERDGARMLVVDRRQEKISHARFADFPLYLKKGDVVVINDSKVIPARLCGYKQTGAVIEILLLARVSVETPLCQTWEALLRPAKRLADGARILLEHGSEAIVSARLSEKKWLLEFSLTIPFSQYLEKYGMTPLPPYIKRLRGRDTDCDDANRYQTIYAKHPGSVAAPTAGLHFTKKVIDRIRRRGVAVAPVTLHVGYGTFLPVTAGKVEEHVMDAEFLNVSEDTAQKIACAKRVVAVGTTAVRTLETTADDEGRIRPGSCRSSLFIYPGYHFLRTDALLTNFHLPKSSLFLLVCAFAGTDLMKRAYEQAVSERYRFYSYGDCMYII